MQNLEKRMQNELTITSKGILGRDESESVWMRFITMANQATTGSLLAKITLVIATVGICFQVAYLFVPYFTSQHARLTVMEQQRTADHQLVIDAVQNMNRFLMNSIEVRKEEIDAQKLPKAKKEELKGKLTQGVKIVGANSDAVAGGDGPAASRN